MPLDALSGVRLMIVDPPYSRYVHKNITSAGTLGEGSRGWHRQDLEFAPLTRQLRTFLARAAASIDGWSLIFSDIESAHLWRYALTAAGAEFVRSIPWVRWSQPQKSGDRPTQGAELVTVAWHGERKKVWNGPGSLIAFDCFDAKSLRGENKHRTEKPLDLLLEMVSWFSSPGDAVFDPCSGSGSTAQACRILGRDFGGFETSPIWQPRAVERYSSPLDERDQERLDRFAMKQIEEANALLSERETEHNQKTRARARRRLADVEIARQFQRAA